MTECKHKNTMAVYTREKYTKEKPSQNFIKMNDYRYCTDCKKIIKVEAQVINGN